MTKFDQLAAQAKANQIANCNRDGTPLAGGAARDGEYCIYVSPVQGRISFMQTVKMNCYIGDKRVSKAKLQEEMGA